jgi:hypothetical protein
MEQLIKKFLTDKAVRNGATLTALVAIAIVPGMPWYG